MSGGGGQRLTAWIAQSVEANRCCPPAWWCRLPLDDPNRFRVEVLFRCAVCGGGWMSEWAVGTACHAWGPALLHLDGCLPCSPPAFLRRPHSRLPLHYRHTHTRALDCLPAALGPPTTPRRCRPPRRTMCCLLRPAPRCTPMVRTALRSVQFVASLISLAASLASKDGTLMGGLSEPDPACCWSCFRVEMLCSQTDAFLHVSCRIQRRLFCSHGRHAEALCQALQAPGRPVQSEECRA